MNLKPPRFSKALELDDDSMSDATTLELGAEVPEISSSEEAEEDEQEESEAETDESESESGSCDEEETKEATQEEKAKERTNNEKKDKEKEKKEKKKVLESKGREIAEMAEAAKGHAETRANSALSSYECYLFYVYMLIPFCVLSISIGGASVFF